MSLPVLSDEEKTFIREAAYFLENPGFTMRAMNAIGKPLDAIQAQLPDSVQESLGAWVQKALQTSLLAAIKTMNQSETKPKHWREAIPGSRKVGWTHTAGVAVTGALGGLFGLVALPLELPISTTIMLRGISSVAAQWGMDLKDPTIQLQCLYVFTLGSPNRDEDDDLDSAYLSSRLAFEKMMRSATKYMAHKSAAELLKILDSGTAPALIKIITRVAKSFQLTLTEKLLAKSVPLIGAVGGATINALFCDYFTEAARYHFGILHMEEVHGRDIVQKEFIAARSMPNPEKT